MMINPESQHGFQSVLYTDSFQVIELNVRLISQVCSGPNELNLILNIAL